MSKSGKSRKPRAIKREIARLLFEGRSLSEIGRTLKIDRHTVSRNSTDEFVQAEIQKLQRAEQERTAPPRTAAAAAKLGRAQQLQIEQRTEKYRRVPLDVVPLASRRLTYLQLQTGEVNREMLSADLLAAVAEYDPNDPRDNPPPEPATAPQHPANPHLESVARELLDGPGRSRPASGRHVVSSVPARLRPKGELDW
jgi:hypothetical protein